ncbi:unnamed protein product [Protopolystoma xenopodis]|uniref:Uncharacterized protein n=1 Tax=Protopolystoma xenopodis TaxID=117903 RepID=A0A3S5BFU3_9PLAT|nr:unnamed protein product [Protopolystoma xenopodis]
MDSIAGLTSHLDDVDKPSLSDSAGLQEAYVRFFLSFSLSLSLSRSIPYPLFNPFVGPLTRPLSAVPVTSSCQTGHFQLLLRHVLFVMAGADDPSGIQLLLPISHFALGRLDRGLVQRRGDGESSQGNLDIISRPFSEARFQPTYIYIYMCVCVYI